ncbi:helix-turn-helix domain-containing protein [Marinitenerispora sediminis]|uniref:Transcriptional regulator n=1 Tax=Marinitenerispora sediminis TaxID=1931232 RepID=A0A368SY36_9ACTN|nr:helix-turn-helix transcriptional regulator [Marinitenerispora sediminis]RCV47412.1 transcriptional regulator [Marinitenerispora sediminis]RCV47544.1 transcriptional regulator [Marinitenerispora sediminis]RCV48213.1 transcriptional regulator [Marinitenerispora sediminis]
MTVGPPVERPARPAFGALLRSWRERRRISQLELASRADSSARHISFIETGRARPSPAMVLRLAEHLDVPVRDRNALLVAAGYAPAFPETPLDEPAMAPLRAEMERLLAAYDPSPALLVNGVFDVLAANRGVAALLNGVPEHLLRPPLNAMRISLHPDGLAPRIRNLLQWRTHLLERVERQLAVRDSVPLRELLREVAAYPVPAGHPPEEHPHAVALPLRIEVGGQLLSFLSTVTTFNTPMDVTVSELAVETLLPADPETAGAMRDLVGAAAGA